MQAGRLHGTLAQVLGVSGSTLTKYRSNGLTAKQADRLAVRAGLHPGNIWSDWVDPVTDLFTRLRNQLDGTRWAA